MKSRAQNHKNQREIPGVWDSKSELSYCLHRQPGPEIYATTVAEKVQEMGMEKEGNIQWG